MALLEMHDLKTFFTTKRGVVKAVNGVSCKGGSGQDARRGRRIRLGQERFRDEHAPALDGNGYIAGGSIMFDGGSDEDALSEMQKIRGNAISVIFQEPMTSLNPVFTIGARFPSRSSSIRG